MPHLSPMMWPSAILTFYFLLMIIMASMWWHTPPKFPYQYPPSSSYSNLNNWKWN